MRTITRDEIKNHLDKDEQKIRLVEALPEEAYNEGHLPGAVCLPQDKVDESAPSLLKDKNEFIVVYCANADCTASDEVAQELEDMGYTNVARYVGGKEDWKQAGLPLDASSFTQAA